nr:zinc finger BED domain-containing protein RICESLEEPER 2-like [Tanacetum cinerariifolium]
MVKRVIAFEDFPVSYTGGASARMLRKVFVNLNLEDKIMSIKLDNASNNTSAIGKLKLKYEPPMDGGFYNSRCVAHIINLVLQDGLAVLAINAIKEYFKTMYLNRVDHLDAQESKQDKFSLKNPVDFEEEILDADVHQIEAIPLSDKEIALDAASCKGIMFGLSLGGEEVDYDMTNYGDDY